MNPFFSIITPVYNVERFIKNTISSVINQTFTNFELLLIDDGSPDNSGAICDEQAKADARLIVFHKKNGGVSSARNMGLEKATGEYIIFLDADDQLTPDALETCYEEIKAHNLDMLQFSIKGMNEDGTINRKKDISHNTTETLTASQYLEKGELQVCAGGSCIKREIIEKNAIRYNTNITLAEDQLFTLACISQCNRLRFCNKAMYLYLTNTSSATSISKSSEIKKSLAVFKDFVKNNPVCEKYINRQTVGFIIKLLYNGDVGFKEIKSLVYTGKLQYKKKMQLSSKIFCVLSKINFYVACCITKTLLQLKH